MMKYFIIFLGSLLVLGACGNSSELKTINQIKSSKAFYILTDLKDGVENYAVMNEKGELMMDFSRPRLDIIDKQNNQVVKVNDELWIAGEGIRRFEKVKAIDKAFKIDSAWYFLTHESELSYLLDGNGNPVSFFPGWASFERMGKNYYVINQLGKQKSIYTLDHQLIHTFDSSVLQIKAHPSCEDLLLLNHSSDDGFYRSLFSLITLKEMRLEFKDLIEFNSLFKSYFEAGLDSFPLLTKETHNAEWAKDWSRIFGEKKIALRGNVRLQFYNHQLEPSSTAVFSGNDFANEWNPYINFRYSSSEKRYIIKEGDSIPDIEYVFRPYEGNGRNWTFLRMKNQHFLCLYKGRLVFEGKEQFPRALNNQYVVVENQKKKFLIDSLGNVKIPAAVQKFHAVQCPFDSVPCFDIVGVERGDSLLVVDVKKDSVVEYLTNLPKYVTRIKKYSDRFYSVYDVGYQDGIRDTNTGPFTITHIDQNHLVYLSYTGAYFNEGQIYYGELVRLSDKMGNPLSAFMEYNMFLSRAADNEGKLWSSYLPNRKQQVFYNSAGKLVWPKNIPEQSVRLIKDLPTLEKELQKQQIYVQEISLATLSKNRINKLLGFLSGFEEKNISMNMLHLSEKAMKKQFISGTNDNPLGDFQMTEFKDLSVGDFLIISNIEVDAFEEIKLDKGFLVFRLVQ